MIKVGDRFNLNNENWEVIFIDNDAVVVARSENGEEGIVSQRTIYKNWYEQQKQRADELEEDNEELSGTVSNLLEQINRHAERADELEKRWSEMREHVIARSDACKERRMIRERDALIDVMAAMHDLEEGDND